MLLPLVTKLPESKCRFFRLPENSASRGQGESARSVAGDKHDNGRTSSDRAGDAGELGRIVGDATHLRGFAARGVFVRCVCRPPLLYIAREGIRNVFKDLCKS